VSAPVVVSVEPGNLETDVILGIPIIITFDQVIDQTTVNDATFALTGPGTTEVETAMNMATLGRLSPTGREYITGTFTFVTTGNTPPNTVVSFVPGRALRKNTTYSVILLGASGSLISNGVRNPAYEGMVNSYEWSFTTGTLDVTVAPNQVSPSCGSPCPRARRRHRQCLVVFGAGRRGSLSRQCRWL